ncbi:MAG: neutral/alkaline non-lysosomal ceramidase N-terminal domain-containing protein, partial [Planctomycetales bacterium]|nr:neutral/alkaline non-lysosomal ceramidase N-terminal domain-containing protein [Planctomycetales bacterium]
MNLLLKSLAGVAVCMAAALSASAADWQAGAAASNITPQQPMPMAGYAGRGAKHAEGKLTDLWAKALVLQDAEGRQAVLVTFDLIGIDRGLATSICQQLMDKYNLQREQIALNFSHTHTGPVVAKNLRPMHYMLLDEANRKLVDDYAQFLETEVVALVGRAMEARSPATLKW